MEIRRNRLAFVRRTIARYGDVVEFRMGSRRLLLVSRPSIVKQVLVDNCQNYRKGLGLQEAKSFLGEGLLTSEGPRWQAQRRRLQPAFRQQKLEAVAAVVAPETEAMLRRWDAVAERGEAVEVVSETTRLTIGVLGAALFRCDLHSTADALSRDLTVAARWAMDRMTGLVRWPLAVPTPANLRLKLALRRLDRQIQDIIDRSHGNPDGLVAAMRSGRPGTGEAGERRLREEVMTMLLAGQETTAATIAWTWYMLARHPEVEAEVRREVENVVGDRPPVLADVPRLAYTTAVIHEVLRLFPPVWMISRKALQADRIDGCEIEKGTDVLISVYGLQRHRDFWCDPDSFQPERFAAGQMHPCQWTFIPFGAGPRACVGSRFGLVEALLVVAATLRRFRLGLVSVARPLEEPLLTLRPRQPLRMRPVPVRA